MRIVPPTTFYIDPEAPEENADGLSQQHPLRSAANINPQHGDTVLFKRGSVSRDHVALANGAPGAPVTYGAYGEGPRPLFLGSAPVADPAAWTHERPNVWRYLPPLPSEACNLIFNNGESCGNYRWSPEELLHQGEWHSPTFGMRNTYKGAPPGGTQPETIYLCSEENPGHAYQSIECALWGRRSQLRGGNHVVVEDLAIRNAGIHGYVGGNARDVTIRNCEFAFIGGGGYRRQDRVRFGNAIEFWSGVEDLLVEGCFFDNIFDSGVTHQGGGTTNIPRRLRFQNNHFRACGMSAYECREPSEDVWFENNLCEDTGLGFSPQGEPPPRMSEIYPQPMGHHVFIWRVDAGTQPGKVYIRGNTFRAAPLGAAIYSIIDPADEALFVVDDNVYESTDLLMIAHMNGRSFGLNEIAEYRKETNKDLHSRFVFAGEAHSGPAPQRSQGST